MPKDNNEIDYEKVIDGLHKQIKYYIKRAEEHGTCGEYEDALRCKQNADGIIFALINEGVYVYKKAE